MMKKRLTIMLVMCMLFITSVAWAQNARTITGVVVSADDGTVVPFASVYVKGQTNIGTQTDNDGKFTLPNVPSTATHLVVSFIGFRNAEADITKSTHLKVVMQSDEIRLNEVVVTALGIQRQAKEIGYATAKVTSDELNAAKGADATAALSGKVSGLQINVSSPELGSTIRVNLRGSRSFKGNNQAMLVLDGVPTPLEYMQTLNPNDIENISVLKGASAAALYGSSAANGVLYVTTKQGNRGKPRITYGLTTTFDKVAYLPKWQTRFGAGQSSSTTGLPSEYLPYENQQYGPEFDGSMKPIGEQLFDPNNPDGLQLMGQYSYDPDGRTGFYQTGVGIQNDISYMSSDDKGDMFLSYQRLDQKGTVEGDNMVRQTVRFNASRKYKNFKAGAKVSYSNTNLDTNSDTNGGMYEVLQIPGNINLRDFRDWRNPSVRGASPDEWVNNYYLSPWFSIDNYRNARRWDRVTAAVDLDYQALPWLKFVARGGLSLGVSNSNITKGAWHFSDWAKKSGERSYANADILSSVNSKSSLFSRLNIDAMAMAEHKINDKFSIKGMLGYSMQETYNDSKNVEAARLQIDNFFNVKNKIGELSGKNEWGRWRKLGVFGSVDLSFKDWAFLQITGRNDWTSLLDPSHWSFFYPGANASVMLTDAIPKLKDNEILSYLKLRGTFARVGTVNIDNYNLADIVDPVKFYFPYGTLAGYLQNEDIRNRNIEPEFTTEFEVGAEVGLLHDRVILEAAFYTQTTDNQTVNVSIPTSSGFETRYVNAGKMRGQGIELDLHITPLLQFGDFRWNVNANATFVRTEVKELVGGVDELIIEDPVYAIKGLPYPIIKATDWVRNPEGKVIVDPVTGYPKAGDLSVGGGTEPTYRIGLSSMMKYKGFTLSATFDYKGGHYTRFGSEYDMIFTGTSYATAVSGRQRFVFPNSVIEIKDVNGNVTGYKDNKDITVKDGNKEFWNGPYQQGRINQVVSAASWRLRELSFGYDVPERMLKKTKFFQKASVSLVGRNLFMWVPGTNVWGDPDYSEGISANASGVAGLRAAGTRSFGFNILVSF